MRSRKLHARRRLLIGLGVFLVLQAALGLWVIHGPPWLHSPNYGYRLSALRARMNTPQGPAKTVVMFGSSLTVNGFRPTLLDEPLSQAAGEPVRVYNFGFWAAGPFRHLLHLRRLIADGARPDLVLIEFMPVLMNARAPVSDLTEAQLPIESLRREELDFVQQHAGEQREIDSREWWLGWTCPGYTHRLALVSEFAPSLLAPEQKQNGFKTVDPGGWIPLSAEQMTPANRKRALDLQYRDNFEALHRMPVGGRAAEFLDELLTLCDREKIPVILIRMPEGPTFRSWCSPEVDHRLDELTGTLQRRHGLTFVNARRWIDHEERFLDSLHLDPEGAALFTRRLGEEVLVPMVRAARSGRADPSLLSRSASNATNN